VKTAFAIVRIDHYLGDVPLANKITVKEILFDWDKTQEEVRRLNQLNHDKCCEYFAQHTRLEVYNLRIRSRISGPRSR
jgi:hypothetical protein